MSDLGKGWWCIILLVKNKTFVNIQQQLIPRKSALSDGTFGTWGKSYKTLYNRNLLIFVKS